jgi:hypothetical protein
VTRHTPGFTTSPEPGLTVFVNTSRAPHYTVTVVEDRRAEERVRDAAPELLAALKVAEKYAKAWAHVPECAADLATIRAAIAKATRPLEPVVFPEDTPDAE